MNEIKTFEIDKTYTFRFIGDADSCVPVKILKRTAKFVTVQVRNEEPTRCKVKIWNGSESCYPLGTYSMCPILSADRQA